MAFPKLELSGNSYTNKKALLDSTHFTDRTYYLKDKEQTFTGTLENKNWNDSLKTKGIFKNGKIQTFTSWYPNGEKNSKMVVTPDSTDQQYRTTTWYYSGALKSRYNKHSGKRYFEDGSLKSKWNKKKAIDFWENGNPKAIWPLKNNKRVSFYHGEFTGWYPDHTISAKGTFKDGRKHGKWVYHDSTGTIEKIIYYKNGKADSTASPA
ncbi:toxin-antitoxin system YwqK family antitoxin [Fodinibius halophilus]|uniref:Toxin-antitoxin system YwqK family antitoxin n=1 Tax=Fodinibius halophilus TaxID=1736908 RepID=A0A6M1TEZ0_9BACT|nr:hypothetical protein [Fodinibius halophilus]NGP88742.1 hypothetical protein [Fodinibius halophilus]